MKEPSDCLPLQSSHIILTVRVGKIEQVLEIQTEDFKNQKPSIRNLRSFGGLGSHFNTKVLNTLERGLPNGHMGRPAMVKN